MQIFIDAEGNATIVTPQHIYQGSNISQVNVISLAFTPQTTLQIAFVLPDGTTTNYYPMSLQYSSTVNYYQYIIQQAFTALSGQASIALLATDSQTQQQTSQLIPFTIEPSVLPTLPDTPSQDEWTTLLAYVQQNSTNIENIQATISDIESIANTANTNASQAVETANQALSTAQQAEETANGYAESIAQANTNASQAVETANQANQTAEQALEQVVAKRGTVVSVGGEYVETLDFNSDPQGQIDTLNSEVSTNTENIENVLGGQSAPRIDNYVYRAFGVSSTTMYIKIGTLKNFVGPSYGIVNIQISGKLLASSLLKEGEFSFNILALRAPANTGVNYQNIIQTVNSTEVLSQIIIDGLDIIFCISNLNQQGLISLSIDYTYSNGNVTPVISTLSDYTPSDEAVVFDCTSTGFETDNIAANNIDTKFINGQPVSQIGGGISLVSSLPTPTQAEYNKHLLYLYAGNLQYLTEVIADEPVVTTPATLPTLARSTSACAVGTDCYIFGGQNSTGYDFNTIIKFDSVSQTATTLSATLPLSLSKTSACAVGTDCYIFGGMDSSGNNRNTIIKFDSVSQTATTLSATLPLSLSNTSACAVGTDCYIFGGDNGRNYQNRIIKFDSVSQTATTLSTTLPMSVCLTSACAVGTDCYIFGGAIGNAFSNSIIKFDSISKTVTTLSPTLPNKMYGTSACAVGTDCYILGGQSSNGFLDTIIKFDSVAQTATTLSATLPMSARSTSACAVGTDCYIFGGYNGTTFNSIVQVAFGVTYTYKIIQTQ